MRLGFLVGDPHPYVMAGLSADNGDIAHNIVTHGRWFEESAGPTTIGRLMAQRRQLVDLADVADLPGASPRLRPEVLEMPGEALLLAGLWTITGDERYVDAQVVQAVVDSLMTLVVFWLSLRLFRRRRAALWAAAMYAVFLPLGWLAKIPHTDTWAVSFTLLLTALLVKALDAERPGRWWLAAGACAGAGVYFRPTILLVLLMFGLCAIPSVGRRRAALTSLVPLGIALLLLAPWTIRNAVVFHQFIPTRIGIGQNLWEGMGEIPNSYGPVLDDGKTAAQVRAVRPDLAYGTPAYDEYLQRKALTLIGAHPAFYGEIVGRRVVYATIALRDFEWASGAESPFAYASRTGRSVLTYPFAQPWDALRVLIVSLWQPLLFLGGLATAIATRRRWGRAHLLLVAVPIGTALPYLVLHLEARYLLPASFVWIVLATLGADLALERWSAARGRASRRVLAGRAS